MFSSTVEASLNLGYGATFQDSMVVSSGSNAHFQFDNLTPEDETTMLP